MVKKKAVKKTKRNTNPPAAADDQGRSAFIEAWVVFCEAVGLGYPQACDSIEFSSYVGLRGQRRMDVKYSECAVRVP